MIHTMKLQESPFEKIRQGKKTIELRLFDAKRQRVKVGDRIEFTSPADPGQKLLTEVKALHRYQSFAEMFRVLPGVAMGFEEGEVPDPKIMEEYYSVEEQKKYGALGIELSLVEPSVTGEKPCCNTKNKLAIFDLDGTLFDTVPANFSAYAEVLEKYGFTIDQDYFATRCNGRYYKDFLPEIIGQDPVLLEAIHNEKIATYPKHYSRIRENKGLFALLEGLSPTYNIALVSTAAKKSVYDILDLFGKASVFDLILTQAEIPRNKPAPDGFLMAMEHFSCKPENTLIFEDSPQGIAAAQAAGAQYFVVKEIL